MSALEHISKGLGQALEGVAVGWHQLRDRATNAITRFSDADSSQGFGTESGDTIGWGLLATEVSEDNNAVTVRLEAPGMEADNFDLQVIGDYLVVRGEKSHQHSENKGRFTISECAYGQFERVIPLRSQVDEREAQASYKKGVLTVILKKAFKGNIRQIPVNRA